MRKREENKNKDQSEIKRERERERKRREPLADVVPWLRGVLCWLSVRPSVCLSPLLLALSAVPGRTAGLSTMLQLQLHTTEGQGDRWVPFSLSDFPRCTSVFIASFLAPCKKTLIARLQHLFLFHIFNADSSLPRVDRHRRHQQESVPGSALA